MHLFRWRHIETEGKKYQLYVCGCDIYNIIFSCVERQWRIATLYSIQFYTSSFNKRHQPINCFLSGHMTYTVKASELLWDKLYPIYEKVMIPAASDALYELGSKKRTHLYFFFLAAISTISNTRKKSIQSHPKTGLVKREEINKNISLMNSVAFWKWSTHSAFQLWWMWDIPTWYLWFLNIKTICFPMKILYIKKMHLYSHMYVWHVSTCMQTLGCEYPHSFKLEIFCPACI